MKIWWMFFLLSGCGSGGGGGSELWDKTSSQKQREREEEQRKAEEEQEKYYQQFSGAVTRCLSDVLIIKTFNSSGSLIRQQRQRSYQCSGVYPAMAMNDLQENLRYWQTSYCPTKTLMVREREERGGNQDQVTEKSTACTIQPEPPQTLIMPVISTNDLRLLVARPEECGVVSEDMWLGGTGSGTMSCDDVVVSLNH